MMASPLGKRKGGKNDKSDKGGGGRNVDSFDDIDEEDELMEASSLARSGRRASISMPTGLDLLTKLAEYTWQNQPQDNSSFDDLVEAGVADASPRLPRARLGGNVAVVPPARRRDGVQSHIPGRHPGSPARIGFLPGGDDDDDNEDGELSKPDFPTSANARVSLNPSANGRPKGKRVGVRLSSKSDDEDDDTDFDEALKPLSVRRKGSVAPIQIHNSNFNQSSPTGNGGAYIEDSKKGGSASPTPSATSISSLIRDKLGRVPIPGLFRNKKAKEYKLQAFVIILFLTIIVLVGSIYIIHKEKELQKSYFDRIRFSSKDRRIRVQNIQDRVVLSGTLGVNLTPRDKAWPCLVEHQRVNETCLEWMGKGRLYLKTRAPPPRGGMVGVSQNVKNNILCYGIYWQGLSTDFTLKDCYDMGWEHMQRGGYFYGGGEMENDNWPLNKTVVEWSPFLTGRKVDGLGGRGKFQWGHSIRRFFVNSEGAAIKITDDSPLYMSINHPERRQICFGAGRDAFSFPKSAGRLPFLNYTICTAKNAFEVSKRLGDKTISERLRHEVVQLTYSVADSPIYKISSEILNQGNQSDAALLNHTDKIASSKLPTNGFILLDETWQEKIGDLEADPERFPNLGEILNITKRRGFRIALTVQPFFSTQSRNYVDGLEKGIWVKERARDTPFGRLQSSQYAPALTEYKQWNSVAVLDVTQDNARTWLREKVKSMAEKYGVEALYADMGTSVDLPQYYQYSEALHSADHSKDLFLQTLRSIPHLSTLGVSTAVKLPKLPTFVSLTPTESSWKGLQSIIPNMLSLGLAGFPFINPGSIGGDFMTDKMSNLDKEEFGDNGDPIHLALTSSNETSSMANTSTTDTSIDSTTTASTAINVPKAAPSENLDQGNLPDRELYIRWLQLSHFLPVVQYSYLPNDYDDDTVKIAQLLEAERRQKIFKFLQKTMNEALTTGLPIIRPLWMIDPSDPNCLRISDEFAIGEDIIVAPILTPNSTERDIYLPKGIWKDELEQSSTKGDRWLHNYKVKLDQIPYFVKLSDSSGY